MVQFWSFVTHVFLILMLAVWIFNTQLLPESPYLWDSVCAPWGSEASWCETFSLPVISTTSKDEDIQGTCQETAHKYCLLLHMKTHYSLVPQYRFHFGGSFIICCFQNSFQCAMWQLCACGRFFWKSRNRLWVRLVISKYGNLERGWLQAVLLNPTGKVWGLQDTHAADHRRTTLN